MASDTDTATPEPGRRPAFLERVAGWWRRSRATTTAPANPETPSLLRRRRTARRSSPLVQGEMVAAGVGEVAVVGGETTINRLDAEAARQLLTRLVRPTGVRARLFSETGELVGDTATLSETGRIYVQPLPPLEAVDSGPPGSLIDRFGDWMARQLSRADRYPEYVEKTVPSWRDFPEVASALRGFNASAVRHTADGQLMLSGAVPVQRYKQVLGALMLSKDNRSIAASLREVRYDMLTIAIAAMGITVLFSLYLARTITQPIVRLARAADEVRLARETRPAIPDLGKRGDEIGDLNEALRSMTDALWRRINAIESFAADVAHELKNPLTSLRSALEVAARPDLDIERRARLTAIIMDDINRLNRLISDISDASRLDADLLRGETKVVDLQALLSELVEHYAATAAAKAGVEVELRFAANPPFAAHGHDGRYGQVFRNVIDNALSFSPRGSKLVIEVSREPRGGFFIVTIDDEGPGIPEENLESVFNRFYSQRPTEHFGQHSGLGLSICRQIMETYGGSVSASNRRAAANGPGAGRVLGARFTVRVPTAGA
jgi:two-component system sensor histidine kinase ChvG